MREVGNGKIVSYFEDRGFGWIHEVSDGGLHQYFFHIRQCRFEPRKGGLVEFEISQGPKGLAALNVRELVPAANVSAGIDALAGTEKSGGAK